MKRQRKTRFSRPKARALFLEVLERRVLMAVDTWKINLLTPGGLNLFGPTAGAQLQNAYTSTDIANGGGSGGTINALNAPTSNNNPPVAANDDFTGTPIDEDSVLNIPAQGVLAGDTDLDPDTLTAVPAVVSSSLGATVTINADGSFSYDPRNAASLQALAVSANTNDTFQYTVSDGRGGFDTGLATVNVLGLNDAPVAQNDAVSFDEDTAGGGDVTADNGSGPDTDPDHGISVTLVNGAGFTSGTPFALPSGALLTMNVNGTFTYDPNGQFENLSLGQSANDNFSYTIDDGLAAPSTAVVSITINGRNDQPIAQDDNLTTDEDTALLGSDVTANNGSGADSDTDAGDTLSVTRINGAAFTAGVPFALPSGALLTMNANGTFDYDPNGQFDNLSLAGLTTDVFSYTVDDGRGQANSTAVGNVTMTINGVNDAPDIDLDLDNSQGVSPDFYAVFSTTTPVPVAIVDTDLDITDPDDTILISATVTITNRPDGNNELLSATPFGLIGAGDISFNAPTGVLTISPVGGASLTDFEQVLRTVTYDNAAGAPTENVDRIVTTVVSDGTLSSPLRTSTVAVLPISAGLNVDLDGNVAGDNFNTSFVEAGIGPGSGPVPIADTDVTITAANNIVQATITLANPQDGVLEGLSVNVPGLPAGITVDAGSTLTNVILNSAGSSAADFQTALRQITYDNTSESPNTLSRAVRVQLQDTTTGFSNTATAQIGITESNDAPVAQDDDVSVSEDASGNGDVLADNGHGADSDPDNSLSVTQVNGGGFTAGVPFALPSGALLTMNTDGTFTYDPNGQFEQLALGETTTDVFAYTIDDGEAQANSTDTANVTITINGQNDQPVAQDDDLSTAADSTLLGASVLSDNGSGADSDADTSDTLSVTLVNGAGFVAGTPFALPSGALLTMNTNGTFDYDPNGIFDSLSLGQSTTDVFSYTINDGRSQPNSTDMANVTITINGSNDQPIAQDDAVSTDEDSPLIGGDVLANNGSGVDSDPDAGDTISVTLVNGASFVPGVPFSLLEGTLTMNSDGTFDYDPAGLFDYLSIGESDTTTFTYTIDDGRGQPNSTDTATVTITINGRNDRPVAQHDEVTTDEDTALIGADVLADNGNGEDSDPDLSNTITVTQVNGAGFTPGVPFALPSGALLTMNTNGTFDYDPNGQYEYLSDSPTTDEFVYTIDDGEGQANSTDPATVTITITGVNDAPDLDLDPNNSGGSSPDFAVTFNESLPAPVVMGDVDLNITDIDDTTIASATITITNRQDGTDELLAASPSGTILAGDISFNASAGTLTISPSGGATIADFVQVLRTATYQNVAVTPTTGIDRIVNLVINDGVDSSPVRTSTVTVLPGPTIDLDSSAAGTGYAAAFVEDGASAGSGPVDIVDTDIVITSPQNLVQATITLANPLDGVAESLAVNVPALPAGITVDAGSTATNVILNSAGSSVTDFQIALRQITYDNTSDDPDTTNRSVNVLLQDTLGGFSNTAVATIAITPANDGPTAQDDEVSVDEDTAGNFDVTADNSNGVDSDPDDPITVSLINGGAFTPGVPFALPSGALLTMNADGTFTYDPNGVYDNLANAASTTDTFSYTVDDGQAQPNSTDSADVTVTINGVNDAPDLDLDADDSGGSSPDFAAVFDVSAPAAVTIADVDLDITDVDGATIATATVTIVNRPDGTNEVLAATPSGTILAGDISYNAGTGILTISPGGGATLADFEAVLQSVTYDNTATTPTAGVDRVVNFVVNDGGDDSPTRTSTVSLQSGLPGPTVDLDGNVPGSDFGTTFLEGSGPIGVTDTDVTVTAGLNLVRATVTLTNPLAGGLESLVVNTPGLPSGITVDAASTATNVILVSAGSSTSDFETALQQVSYSKTPSNLRVSSGLVALYGFDEGTGTTVSDVSGNGTALNLTIADPGAVTWVSGGLSIDSSTIISSAGPATKINDAVTASNEITVEAWIQPDSLAQSGPARIVTMSADTGNRNFTLGQDTNDYVFRLRSTSTTNNGIPETTTGNVVQTSSLAHVVFTRNAAGATSIYVDGVLEASGTAGGDLSTWDANYLFALGNELTNDRPWLGDFQLVSVYDRALNLSEVQQNFNAGANPSISDRLINVVLQDSASGFSNTAVTTIAIGPANIAPTAAAHAYDTVRDVALSVTPDGLLENAFDPEGQTLTVSAYDAASANGGTITAVDVNTGAFTYTPPSGFTGVDTFDYTITDGFGGFDTATVTVTVSSGEPDLDLDPNNSGGSSPNFAAVFDVNLLVPVVITDSDLDIDDVNSSNLASATVTITNRQDGSNEILAATPSGSIGAGEISFNASTGVLTITPVGGAPLTDFEQVLRTVSYDNTASTPTTGIDRSVSFVVNDGVYDSAVRTSSVAVTAVSPSTASFPGAVGFGATATGGRGGDVYHVTNLLDYGASDPVIVGSFRHAIDSQSGPRTIVFDTGGNLELERTLNIGADDLTIAGQTAPGDGITIWGYGVKIVNSNNLILRGLRFRVGDFNAVGVNGKPSKGNGDLLGDQADPLEIGWSDRVIIDHVSATWGIDETLTVWESTNITVQNSILAESLNDSYHDKGPHGYGAILRGAATPTDRANGEGGITYYGNLISKHTKRNPGYNSGTGGTDLELVNNVIYNWGHEPGHSETNIGVGVDARINYINNYVIAGPDSNPSLINIAFHEFSTTGTLFYHSGTYLDSDLDAVHDGVAVGDSAFYLFEDPFLTTPLNFPAHLNGDAVTAQQAYTNVVAGVGDYLHRDFHDQRIIDEMTNRNGQIIDSQDDLIALAGIPNPIVPLDPGTPPVDSDGDGMPDTWETTNSLNPSDPADRNLTNLSGADYTNLEVYLNSLFVAPLKASSVPATEQDPVITEDDVATVVDAALDIWSDAGLSNEQLALLAGTKVEVAPLQRGWLGEASVGVIRLDDNAAGWGWFVDPTPGNHSEFELDGGQLRATSDNDAFGRMDLLTAVLHEQGHLLGFDHVDDTEHLMYEELSAGTRRLPGFDDMMDSSELDGHSAFFSELGSSKWCRSSK